MRILYKEEYKNTAEALADKLGVICQEWQADDIDELYLLLDANGLSLVKNQMTLTGDFTSSKRRLKQGVVGSEIVVKAAKIKGGCQNLKLLDATAGMGEDSLLLAAAGFDVTLYEQDRIIAALLADTIERAKDDEELNLLMPRMHLMEGDSITAMNTIYKAGDFDVIYLDPMFPERDKSALIKKKFQLLHYLERPCSNENELIEAAMSLKPKKLVIKRPIKGDYLAGRKPDYSISGKAVRYDCFTFA